MSLYTLEIEGRAVAVFAAEDDAAASDLAESEWMEEDLYCLLLDGKPIWDGQSDRHTRLAEAEEEAEWQRRFAAARADGQEPDKEDWLIWIGNITDSTDT